MVDSVTAGIQSTYHLPLIYLRLSYKWYVLYLLLMGCTSIRIQRWVVTLIIFFALYNPIFSVRAKFSGVATECLVFATTYLTVPFLCDIFTLAFTLLMRLGAAFFTFIDFINCSSAISSTSESVIDTKIRLPLWKISLRLPLLRFPDIPATHAPSLYGIFMFVVTFSVSHLTPPYINNMWVQVST